MVMEWQQKQQQQQQRWVSNPNAEMKVMTDEQVETLRKQIAVYSTLCEQLIEMHKTLSTHQDLAGVRLGGMYCDPLISSGGHKISSRQRWTPTAVQLQTLEQIFEAGTGTPSKEKIKEITTELSQHGQISETNVYNWFQNRRARSKRKQQSASQPSGANAESEVETEVDSKEKKTKPGEFVVRPGVTAENHCFQNPDVCSDLHYLSAESDGTGSLRSTRGFDHAPSFDGLLSSSRSDYLTGKMEAPESYNLYQPTGDFDMSG